MEHAINSISRQNLSNAINRYSEQSNKLLRDQIRSVQQKIVDVGITIVCAFMANILSNLFLTGNEPICITVLTWAAIIILAFASFVALRAIAKAYLLHRAKKDIKMSKVARQNMFINSKL